MRRVVVLALVVLAAASRHARADEIAPELETLELRQKADAEAKKLLAGLSPNDQRRLTGMYVAFDPNPSDPSAMVACDDDGDYVIVVTDAMLRLVSIVARAQSYDEVSASRSIENYASFLARTQVPGRRLLPPPPGFYAAQKAAPTQDTRLREALSFVLARELTHMRAGDLVCAHPSATHESGDDVWTSSEQRRALEGAANVYRSATTARDEEATTRVLDAGRTEEGALGLLRFFAQLDVERAVAVSRFAPTYAAQHPAPLVRAAAVASAAKNHRSP
ncbi:MAG: hypothetical protein JWP87_582 [Labilithrix sp.]|nr:hypothetical protein [Labilithrix sp.]